VYDAILERVASGTLAEGQVKGVVHKLVQGVPLAQALQVEKQDDDTLAHAIRALLVEKPGLRANAYMGLLIGKLGAHIDKAQAMKLLQELVP
jgi:hypothetical protein